MPITIRSIVSAVRIRCDNSESLAIAKASITWRHATGERAALQVATAGAAAGTAMARPHCTIRNDPAVPQFDDPFRAGGHVHVLRDDDTRVSCPQLEQDPQRLAPGLAVQGSVGSSARIPRRRS